MPESHDLPQAMARPPGRRIQLVWIIPLIAALIGIWLAAKAIMERGPTITITFATAEGLEAGKTRIRYREVDVGFVKEVALTEDSRRVVVTAQLVKQAEPFVVSDSRFWVVRPNFSGGQVSGFGTLLSGAYIGLDAGKSGQSARDFTGLEIPPIITAGLSGKQFSLQADNLGSLDIGSPIYFRRLKVGQVVAYGLTPDGSGVDLKIFIHAPYDQQVHPGTRFWNASGIDIALDATGLKVQTQSATSLLSGGLAFETPPGNHETSPAPADSSFTLHRDRSSALKAPDGEMQVYSLLFKDSLRGLSVGAPVDFRGVVVGEVLSMGVEYDPKREWFDFPVFISFYPERIAVRHAKGDATNPQQDVRKITQGMLKAMVERGLRAQLRTGNLLTGQLFIALDFFKDAPKLALDTRTNPPTIPTLNMPIQDLQASITHILKGLEKVPYGEIGGDLRNTLQSVDQLARRLDGEVAPETRATLAELRKTLQNTEKILAADSPVIHEVREAAREIARAAHSLRSLADTLDRQPESLLKGKREEQP